MNKLKIQRVVDLFCGMGIMAFVWVILELVLALLDIKSIRIFPLD